VPAVTELTRKIYNQQQNDIISGGRNVNRTDEELLHFDNREAAPNAVYSNYTESETKSKVNEQNMEILKRIDAAEKYKRVQTLLKLGAEVINMRGDQLQATSKTNQQQQHTVTPAHKV
jgi:hypothetical protein